MTGEIRRQFMVSPTIRSFMLDDSFVRGLMGPIGSGKSSGCVTELMRRAGMQAKGTDGKRRSRWAIVRNCYDAETEILTERRGWVRFPDLLEDDAVATLKDGRLTFEVPTYHYAAPYAGPMVGIRSQNVDLLVTPEHHLWASHRRGRAKVWQPYEHVRAQDIEGIGEVWRMTSVAEPAEGGRADRDEAFFEFLGLWFAEGCASITPRRDGPGRHYRLIIVQKKYRTYVEDVLRAAGLKWGVAEKVAGCAAYAVSVRSAEVKALIAELAGYGHARTKRIPRYVMDAPAGHIRAFLRGYQMGDGSFKTGPRDCEHLYTASRGMADDLHELVVRSGRCAVMNYDPTNDSWVVTIKTPLRSGALIMRDHWRREHYEGVVYCVEVSTHVVYVRRNGKAVWCGQTYRELIDTTVATFFQWVPPDDRTRIWRQDQMKFTVSTADMEVEFLFRALDKPKDARKLLSLELTGAWINEARELPKVIVDMLQGRVGRYPGPLEGGCSWSGIFMDTNPPDNDHWWYRTFEEKRPEGWGLYRQPGGLDPNAENLDWLTQTADTLALPVGHPKRREQGRVYYRRMMAGKSDEWIKVYVNGDYGFVQEGKAVYPEYADRIHASPTRLAYNPALPLLVGVDASGLWPAAVACQLTPFGQLRALREFLGEVIGASGFSEQLRRWIASEFPSIGDAGLRLFIDPAGMSPSGSDEKTYAEYLQAVGFSPMPAPSNQFSARREAVALYLSRLVEGQPALLVDSEGCPVLRKGFQGGYSLKRVQVKGEERYRDEPDKTRYSHPHDGLQYAALGAGAGPSVIARKPPPPPGWRKPPVRNPMAL